MRTVFACIAYLRDLFPEKAFEDDIIAGMTLKRIRPNVSPGSDRFIDWIEKGCFDVLAKKYVCPCHLNLLAKDGHDGDPFWSEERPCQGL